MAQQKDGIFTWLHSDHLHSATVLTDADGLEIRRLAYTAFGEEAANSGPGAAPQYTYTDKERDRSGLLYYGARYYDPALVHFITADSVYDAGPQGLNRYSYALNNPILYRDPTGKISNPFTTFFSGWYYTPKPVREALGKTLQAEAQGTAAGMIEGATTGALVYTSLAVPGVGEALDLAVIFGGDRTTTTQKMAAGASLVISALTIGLGPNYGSLNDTMAFPSAPSS